MSRCKLLVAVLVVLVVGVIAQADDEIIFIAQATPAPTSGLKAPAAPSARRSVPEKKTAHKTRTRTEVGIGYLAWNDDFAIHGSGSTANGVSSFGGVALFVEQSWFLKRWQLGVNVAVASGKASASASGDITYSDGTNRAWSAQLVEPFARYAINNYVLLGAGLLYKHQSITWDSADTTLSLDPKNTQLSGQFDFKIAINKHWSIGQSYAPLGFKGRSLWFTSGSYAF